MPRTSRAKPEAQFRTSHHRRWIARCLAAVAVAEAAFYGDPHVLFVSSHQYPYWRSTRELKE
jgi:hypothetical protein